jgi:predicted ATP-dependent endonuclease of OLD family
MRLQRVQTPNFRVLKDIDITFEPHRIPQIFPLASQNGGGKSTLLQLLFTLLTCNDDSDKTGLVKNLLLNAGRNNFINGSELSTIELVDNGNLVKLDFNFHDNPAIYDSFLAGSNGDEKTEQIVMLSAQNIRVIYCKDEMTLICKATSHTKEFDFVDFLKRISEHVFIAAPSSQAFLFLAPEDLALLFKGTSEYYNILIEKQRTIKNLFLYDFFMVKVLTDAFSKAFESDRAQAIKSGGKYGTEFASLLNDLKNFFNGKTIQPSEDLSRIIIRQRDNNGQEVELNPIDLSHGELRRLAFYAWLKTNKIKDSIVLIDEIEIGMHPDWQYQIVRDLEEWEPSNQYILATHSYEVCSALSPSHVKEIEPKLLKSEAQTAQ